MALELIARKALSASFAALAMLYGADVAAAPDGRTLSELEASVAGSWLGEFAPQPGMPLQRFVMTLAPDGAFTTRVRTYDRDKVVGELSNSGLWGASNGLFFTITLTVDQQRTDPKWPSVVNPYLIQRVMGDTFIYLHIPSGNVFNAKRVSANYVLPAGKP